MIFLANGYSGQLYIIIVVHKDTVNMDVQISVVECQILSLYAQEWQSCDT